MNFFLLASDRSCSDEMLAATFRRCTDDDSGMNVISYDKLGSESGLFWHCYVLYSSPSEMVNEKDDYKWDAKLSFDVVQASLLPDLSVFCEYIATLVRSYLIIIVFLLNDRTLKVRCTSFVHAPAFNP